MAKRALKEHEKNSSGIGNMIRKEASERSDY